MKQDEQYKGVVTFAPASLKEWRSWLAKNHACEESVWLILYKKSSGVPSISQADAIDEALCFGWIDSVPNKRDGESFYQFFSKRKPKSNWSAVNKANVTRLMEEGRMTAAGLAMVNLAKQTGTWDALNDVDALAEPADLLAALAANAAATEYWQKFPRSARRGILEWIGNAKKEETRAKRIAETVTLAAQNIRANQFRQPKGGGMPET